MSDFLRRYVLHDFGLKLVSLALAVGLWLAIARDPVAEVAVDVPIEFRNIAENMEISSEVVPQAQIRLRGPEYMVRQLKASDVRAEIDLAGLRPGERTFDLTSQQVHRPRELEVVQVIPNEFHLSFDTRATRQVEIHPRVVGSFASGYRIAQIVVEPSSITISGPRKRVEAVEAAITDPIDVSGTMDRISAVRHAYVSDPMIQVNTPDPARITVIMEKTPEASAGH
jgi:YbbR domain-containing protein